VEEVSSVWSAVLVPIVFLEQLRGLKAVDNKLNEGRHSQLESRSTRRDARSVLDDAAVTAYRSGRTPRHWAIRLIVAATLLAPFALAACGGTRTRPPRRMPDWFGAYSLSACLPSRFWAYVDFVDTHVSCTRDPLGSGRVVAKYAIENSDAGKLYPENPPRGDAYSSFLFKSGDMDKYISVPLYTPTTPSSPGAAKSPLPASITNDAHSFLQVWQLHNYGADVHPQFGIGLTSERSPDRISDGQLHLYVGYSGFRAGRIPIWDGPPIDDRWHTIILHVHTESCGGCSNGYIQLWFDGARQRFYNGSTSFRMRILERAPNGSYESRLDLDQYRARDLVPGTYTLYHGAAAIGPTYESVAATLADPPYGP
jgi:hypothetical protein